MSPTQPNGSCLLVSAPAESHRARAIIRSSAERCREQQTNHNTTYLILSQFQWDDSRPVPTEGDTLQKNEGGYPPLIDPGPKGTIGSNQTREIRSFRAEQALQARKERGVQRQP